MPKQELLGEVKKLINLGKRRAFTYDDLNNTAGRCRFVRPVQYHHDHVR